MHTQAILIILLLPFLALSSPLRRQNNLQPFSGALGGEAATPVEDSGNAARPFQVGQDTFVNIGAALQRSCDQQFNRCANLANGGDKTLSVADCQAQKDQCSAADAGAGADAGGDGNDGNEADAGGNANNAGSENAGVNGDAANSTANAATCG